MWRKKEEIIDFNEHLTIHFNSMKIKNCTRCNTEITEHSLCDECYNRIEKRKKKEGRGYITDMHDYCNVDTSPAYRELMYMGDIYDNSIECPDCHDVVRSKNLHHYISCKCGRCAVDWWSWYAKVHWQPILKTVYFTHKNSKE